MTKFSHLSNAQLTSTIKSKTEAERRLTVEIIELLEEVDRRKLHLEMGYGSLMDYCVKELRYSESAAYRRISAMRLSRDVPQVKEALKEGVLNLSTATQAQSLFKEAASQKQQYSANEKMELLSNLKNTSARQAERIIAEKRPAEAPRRDDVRAIAGHKVRAAVELREETHMKIERLKKLLSHKNPNPSFDELLSMVADIAIKQLDPSEQKSIERKAKPPAVKPRSISVNKRRIVWKEAQAKCTYVDPKSGRQCGSRHQLEVDHRIPVAKGGSAENENLRLLCRAHNQLMAEKHFGAAKLSRSRNSVASNLASETLNPRSKRAPGSKTEFGFGLVREGKSKTHV